LQINHIQSESEILQDIKLCRYKELKYETLLSEDLQARCESMTEHPLLYLLI